jgi:hypothetical protein
MRTAIMITMSYGWWRQLKQILGDLSSWPINFWYNLPRFFFNGLYSVCFIGFVFCFKASITTCQLQIWGLLFGGFGCLLSCFLLIAILLLMGVRILDPRPNDIVPVILRELWLKSWTDIGIKYGTCIQLLEELVKNVGSRFQTKKSCELGCFQLHWKIPNDFVFQISYFHVCTFQIWGTYCQEEARQTGITPWRDTNSKHGVIHSVHHSS